ncbi:MAG: hypothetical protein L0215_01560 [Gemmataceae bacterium]|nr:hypothetical protein [Gemmataceae bacterium]
MARSARRFDFYLPLADNTGRAIAKDKFAWVETTLLARFGGLTAQKRDFPLKGIWQGDKRVFIDEVILMTVLDFQHRDNARFINKFKKELRRDFEQIEILITESTLRVH